MGTKIHTGCMTWLWSDLNHSDSFPIFFPADHNAKLTNLTGNEMMTLLGKNTRYSQGEIHLTVIELSELDSCSTKTVENLQIF